MRTRTASRRAAFTLIELLVVVAIISLLIAIVVPSIGAARTQAKKASTRARIDAISKGAELFNAEYSLYPQSRGNSPFHATSQFEDASSNPLFGAQWLALQLAGADLRGWVNPVLANDTGAKDQVIDATDWNEWYSLQPDRTYARGGPYVDASKGKTALSLNQLIENATVVDYDTAAIAGPIGGRNNFGTGDVPVFLDAWGRPLLYYRANPGTDQPFTTGAPGTRRFTLGRFDQTDNGGFTGTDGANGFRSRSFDQMLFDGQQAGGHLLAEFEFNVNNPTNLPEPETFEAFFYDRNLFEQTKQGNRGRVWPYNAETFILVSAGADGRYGTDDDVLNFTK